MTAPRTRAYLYLFISVVIWGIAGPVIKYTLGSFDPLVFLVYRFFLSSLLLFPALLLIEPNTWQTLAQLDHRDWLFLIISATLGSAGQLGFLFWGLSLTTAIDGTLLTSTSPILVAAAGAVFLHEHVTRREKIGLFIAFLGTLVIISQSLFESGALFSGNFFGNILVMIGNFCWVGNVIIGKKLLRHRLSPLLQTTFSFFLGLVVISAILFSTQSPSILYQQLATSNFAPHLGVAYMAFLSGALAYFLYRQAQKTIEASEADVFVYLQPLFATPLAYFWLAEPITTTFLVGSAVIASGVLMAETKTH